MSTTVHPELSEKNQYRIDKHRYYELKHFLQYSVPKAYVRFFDQLSKHLVSICTAV